MPSPPSSAPLSSAESGDQLSGQPDNFSLNEAMDIGEDFEEDSTKDVEKPTKKKGIKPQKKLKVDKDENAFQDMIQSYKKAFAGGNQVKEGKNERSEITKKRWFD